MTRNQNLDVTEALVGARKVPSPPNPTRGCSRMEGDDAKCHDGESSREPGGFCRNKDPTFTNYLCL